MKDAVVAGSVVHAKALIKWAGLDANRFEALAYGQAITDQYIDVLLVRPLAGLTPDQQTWICDVLVPAAFGNIGAHPPEWKPYHDTAAEERQESSLEENPLWA